MFLLILKLHRIFTILKNFNTSHVSINRMKIKEYREAAGYFNTSHVSINLSLSDVTAAFIFYFNTSHVSINPPILFSTITLTPYFNTSHVSINPFGFLPCAEKVLISIHLMFLLIYSASITRITEAFISIHLMFLLIPL